MKCHQYWESKEDETGEHGNFKVKTTAIDSNENYSVASLEITNIKTDETRIVSHWQFTSWRKLTITFLPALLPRKVLWKVTSIHHFKGF